MYKSLKERFFQVMAFGPALRTLLYAYAFGLLATICHASPLIRRSPGEEFSQDAGEKLTAQTIIAGVILILLGLIFCFWGRRHYRLTLFLVGFYVGAIITYIILANAESDNGYSGKHSATIYLVVTIVVGFLIGTCFACCATIAIWLLGALAGYALALFILAWANDGVIKSHKFRVVLFAVLIVLGLLFAIFFKTTTVILFTAFVGAVSVILGVDMFARTGFAKAARAFIDGRHDIPYKVDTKVYIMLGAVIVLFIIGAIVQWRFHRGVFGPQRAEPSSEEGKQRKWWRRRWRNWR